MVILPHLCLLVLVVGVLLQPLLLLLLLAVLEPEPIQPVAVLDPFLEFGPLSPTVLELLVAPGVVGHIPAPIPDPILGQALPLKRTTRPGLINQIIDLIDIGIY